MRQVSDAFLLNMAEVSAALIGLFLVGVFFYVETGFRRSDHARVVERYFRASTRIVLVLYAIPLVLSLTLVVLEPIWGRALFALLSLMLLAANVDTAVRIRGVAKVTRSPALLVNEVVGSVGVLALIVIPWILGGFHPSREDLTWAILLSFVTGFISIGALVLSAFDIARFEAADRTGGDGPRNESKEERMIPAREFRFNFVIDDYEAAAHLYRDVFGLEVLEELNERGRGIILKVPAATLELVDVDHGGMVDEIEVGRRVGDRVRIAVKVDDLAEASQAIAGTGAEAMAAPVETPWGDHNQRFRAKDGIQLTLFQSP